MWRLVVAIVGLALVAAACGDDPAQSATDSASAVVSATPTTRVDPVPIADVDVATRTEILEDLRSAVAALRSGPVEIALEMDEDGEPRSATVRVDRGQMLLAGEWLAPTARGAVITTRHVVVDDRFFLKSTTSAEAEAALDFTELPLDPVGTELIEAVFTGYGRLSPSLDRILLLVEELPFAARVTDFDGGKEISVVMSPIAIYNYYGENRLESVGGAVPTEPTQLAFRIEDGVLVGIVAGGTHFHDGEALEVSATVAFTPIDAFALEVPPIQE